MYLYVLLVPITVLAELSSSYVESNEIESIKDTPSKNLPTQTVKSFSSNGLDTSGTSTVESYIMHTAPVLYSTILSLCAGSPNEHSPDSSSSSRHYRWYRSSALLRSKRQ